MSEHSASPARGHCQNCGAELAGHYCHRCGQRDFDFHRSFGHVFLEAVEGLLHFDEKFFLTITTLLFRPGRLSANSNADTGSHSDSAAGADPEAQPDPRAEPFAHSHAHPKPRPDADGQAHADTEADADSHADFHAHAPAEGHADSHADADLGGQDGRAPRRPSRATRK